MSEAQPRLSLSVNGEPLDVTAGWTIAELVTSLELGDRKIAVALNGEVAPRGTHATRVLHDGDEVEILEAVGGG